MASFTALVPLNLHWYGNALVGAAGTTHRIPDAHYDEFHVEVEPNIPGGVTWRSLVDDSNPAVVTLSSLTATAARFKGEPWVDVKAYGALGDGSTDDTSAVQTAQATGRHIYFSPSTAAYIINGSISATTAGQIFMGPATVKLGQTRTNSLIEVFRVSAESVVIRDMTIDGGNYASYAINPGADWLIELVPGASYCRVENVTFKGLSKPSGHLASAYGDLGQGSGLGNAIINCHFLSMGGGAIFLKANEGKAIGNTIVNTADVAIVLNSIEARNCLVISNNVYSSDPQAAIAVEEGAYDWVIAGNAIRNAQRGLHIMSSIYTGAALGGGIFANNVIIDGVRNSALGATDNFGVHIESTKYKNITIRGNRFAGLPSITASTSFVYVAVATEGLIVEDNLFEAKATAVNGITFTVTGQVRALIRRNVIRSTSTSTLLSHGIWIAGAYSFSDSEISNNVFENATEGVTWAGTGFVGRVADNRIINVTTAYVTMPTVGTVTAPTLPHSYDTATAGLEFSITPAGSWTPIVQGVGTTGAGTYTAQTGKYHKVGKLVFFELRAAWTAHTGSGQLRISGLPFTISSIAVGSVIFPVLGTYAANPVFLGNPSATTMDLYNSESSAAINLAGTGTLLVSGVYVAA